MTSATSLNNSIHAPHVTVRAGTPVQLSQPASHAGLDSELLRLTLANIPVDQARNQFRVAVVNATRAVGACHLIEGDSSWQLDATHCTGRCPDPSEIDRHLAEACQQVATRRSPQISTLEFMDGLTGVFVDLGQLRHAELLMVIFKTAQQAAASLPIIQQIAATLQKWLRVQLVGESDWQLQSIASITELMAAIAKSETVQHAAETIANEMTRQLENSKSIVGIRRGGKLEIAAISGVAKIDRSSSIHQNCLQAAYESSTRGAIGIYPALNADNSHLLLAHKQLVASMHNEAVISQPLITDDGNEIGVWLFTGEKDRLHSDRLSRFVEAASPHVAGVLELLARSETRRFKRAIHFIQANLSRQARWMVISAVVGLWLLMFIPVTYRVRCNGTVEPVSRRFAVAPFDGLITAGFVEAGDLVAKEQVLAEIDGREIRWELSGVTAERQKSLRQRAMMLNEGNIPETFLAELQNDRLNAQEKILNFRKQNLQIRSPIAGVVLSGSLERAEAASVTTGQVLFEIGPTTPMKVEIEIPAEDIPQVRPGHLATVWIDGQENEPIRREIAKIHPRSEIRDARNVFIAEIRTSNDNEFLRPGMEGVVRIDGEQRSLGWTLFHKPMNYLRSRFTWW